MTSLLRIPNKDGVLNHCGLRVRFFSKDVYEQQFNDTISDKAVSRTDLAIPGLSTIGTNLKTVVNHIHKTFFYD